MGGDGIAPADPRRHGDLGRFYMARALDDPELAGRYWSVVEELAANGDQVVESAVHTSLIERFAWARRRRASCFASGGPVTRLGDAEVGQHRRLRQRHPGGERDGNARVPQIMQADRLTALTVQPRLTACAYPQEGRSSGKIV